MSEVEYEKYVRHDISEEIGGLERAIKDVRLSYGGNDLIKCVEKLNSISKRTEQISNHARWLVLRADLRRGFEQATEKEAKQLQELNDQFFKLQTQTREHYSNVKNEMEVWLKNDPQYLTDYEIETEVRFFIDETDPKYNEDIDNFIGSLTLTYFLHQNECEEELDNCNEFQHWDDHPLKDHKYCAFFHAFLDHITPQLSLDDVLRVTEIWIDMNVYHQNIRNVHTLKPV